MNNSEELVVGANGSVHVAPVGTTLPATISDALDAAFVELGYCDEDGVTFTDGKNVEKKRAWQSFYPVRNIITERTAMAAWKLEQWNTDNVQLAFGGGAVTEPSAGEFKYTPPDPEELDERALVVLWQDGDKNYAIVVPKGMVEEDVETKVTRTDLSLLPITFGVIGESGEDPWYFLTDDPAFEAAS